jgi:hypothetical protein
MAKPTEKEKYGVAIELYPSRLKRKLKKILTTEDYQRNAPPDAQPMKGGVDPDKGIVVVPDDEDGYARAIRVHEAAHMVYSKKLDGSCIENILEDIKVQLLLNPQGLARRDEVVAALIELRNVAQTDPEALRLDPECWNSAVNMVARALAILKADSANYPRLLKQVEQQFWHGKGKHINKQLQDIIHDMLLHDRDAARKKLQKLLQIVDSTEKGGFQYGMAKPARGKPEKGDDIDIEPTSKKPTHYLPLLGEPWYTPFDKVRGRRTVMHVHHLAMEEGRPQKKSDRYEVTAMTGMKIRKRKLAMALTPCPPRLFNKVRRRPGGTVLIDASSSMDLEKHHLIEAADALPGGTVAYYYGMNHDSYTGHLFIFAEKGRMCVASQLVQTDGENVVDFPALKWLLDQPAPRWFMTDRGFCSGSYSESRMALTLLGAAENSGRVKVVKQLGVLKRSIKDRQKLDAVEQEIRKHHAKLGVK